MSKLSIVNPEAHSMPWVLGIKKVRVAEIDKEVKKAMKNHEKHTDSFMALAKFVDTKNELVFAIWEYAAEYFDQSPEIKVVVGEVKAKRGRPSKKVSKE